MFGALLSPKSEALGKVTIGVLLAHLNPRTSLLLVLTALAFLCLRPRCT
jgi:hypothetical protein